MALAGPPFSSTDAVSNGFLRRRAALGGPATPGRTNTMAAPGPVSARWHETIVAVATVLAANGVVVPRQLQSSVG